MYIGIVNKESNMRTLTKFTSAVFIALASFSYTANATLILEWNSNSSSSNTPATGASAKATLNFFDDMGLVRIDMVIRNTTGEIASFGDGATTSKLTGIAFDLIEPNNGLNPANFTGGTFLTTMIIAADAQPFGTLDFAAADNSNFNGGNANGALPEAMEDSVSVKIGFNGLTALQVEAAFKAGFMDNSLNYVARFQQVNAGGGSDKLNGGDCCGDGGGNGGGPPTEVPEPSMLFLLGGALLALSLRQKRLNNN